MIGPLKERCAAEGSEFMVLRASTKQEAAQLEELNQHNSLDKIDTGKASRNRLIRAEVMAFDELIAAKTWDPAKAAGKPRLEGKDYPVKDGDIVHIRFKV